MRLPAALLILVISCITTSGCYPEQLIAGAADLSSVTTLVDSQAPLREARTFALPDTVVHAARAQGEGLIGHDGDAAILAKVRDSFLGRGWREIANAPAETPDVVVLVVVLEQSNTGVAYTNWWSSWGWWPGWPIGYGPDWAWGYPGNAVTFTYETGTLIVAMLDTQHGDESSKRVPLIWAGAVNGVLTESSLDGALTGIDQMFAQSPYLQRP